MTWFAGQDSIVRNIWGKADTVLLIFAGASAEFALNKSVDWLYFTGRLPADPLGRLFSTVEYARKIIFSSNEEALAAIDQMKQIHAAVEKARGTNIPDWAYRDVLFMLIYYSINAFELLERPLAPAEKEEVTNVFLRVGNRMEIPGLPHNYAEWKKGYAQQVSTNLAYTSLTADLYKQYRRHLGGFRYFLLIELQKSVVSEKVRNLLKLPRTLLIPPLLLGYKMYRTLHAEGLIRNLILPSAYRERVKRLDVLP